jgi:Ca2+-binding RTX toxin-like protein
MRRRAGGQWTFGTILAAFGVLLTVGAASASAATVTPGSYTAVAAETNNLTVTDNGATLTFVDPGAAITGAGGCLPAAVNPAGTPVTCTDTGNLNINLNDLNDQTSFVGAVDDTINQDGGAGSDTLRGSSGQIRNSLDGGAGADLLAGGPGAGDVAQYALRVNAVNVSLDDVANDGEAGENDNVLSAVEDVATGSGGDTVSGSPANNDIQTGSGNDVVFAGAGDDTVLASAGADQVSLGAGDDFASGDSGADLLDGGDGNDFFTPGSPVGLVGDGADQVFGGTGLDAIAADAFAVGPGPAVTITLDDLADDGIAGDGDNYHSDIEDASSQGGGNDTIVGTSAFNILNSSGGNDSITGGAGNDALFSGAGNDTIAARDAFADRVDCGTGADTAIVDTLDQVSPNCESVLAADVGNANEDVPPQVAFASPADNALLPGRASTVTVTASDDRGVARVVLIDDGRVVATDTEAPYAFTYQPAATDVGANTLIAQAVDASNQAGTAIRNVRVDRFVARRLSETITPARDRARPYRFRVAGALSMPAGVTRAQGCGSGTVKVRARRGSRTVFARSVRIKRNCTYAVTAKVSAKGRLRLTATFSGNGVLKSKASSRRSARAG